MAVILGYRPIIHDSVLGSYYGESVPLVILSGKRKVIFPSETNPLIIQGRLNGDVIFDFDSDEHLIEKAEELFLVRKTMNDFSAEKPV